MAVVRPADVLCSQWEPTSVGAKACRYYLRAGAPDVDAAQLVQEKRAPREAGMCRLPSELLCVEWVRRSGTPAQRAALTARQSMSGEAFSPSPVQGGRRSPDAPADPDAPPPLVLRAQDPAPARAPVRVAVPGGELAMAPPRPYEPAKAIDPASLEALERAGAEVELAAPHLAGTITLVPARTGRLDRAELTFREAAAIRLIVDAFPGAHVTAYRPGPTQSAVPASNDLLQRVLRLASDGAAPIPDGSGPAAAEEVDPLS
jgi:hypothetical protein